MREIELIFPDWTCWTGSGIHTMGNQEINTSNTGIRFLLHERTRVARNKLFKLSNQHITFLVFHEEVLPLVQPVHPSLRKLKIVISISDRGDALACRAVCRICKRNGNEPRKRSAGPSKGESARLPYPSALFSYMSLNRREDGMSAIPKGAGSLTIASRSNVVRKEGFITFTTRYIYISLVVKREDFKKSIVPVI